MTDELWGILKTGLNGLNVRVDDGVLSCFSKFLMLYMHRITCVNLSSIRTERDVIIRHFLDSVAVVPVLRSYNLWRKDLRYLDLGSGGGFPGIPLKIIAQDYSIDLAEVTAKKISFLQEVLTELSLDSHIRNSSIAKITNHYDVILVRAFGSLKNIFRESKKYYPQYIVAYKGKLSKVTQELSSLKNQYTTILESIQCPHLPEERSILIIKMK